MKPNAYDAIIVGGSFAGLALAQELQGDILLLERKELGTGQTSACATSLDVIESLGLSPSVLQVHRHIYIHTSHRVYRYPLSRPFCTFDYGVFCRLLAERISAEVVRARVLGLEGGAVATDRGSFSARLIIDASGWRAVLGRQSLPGLVERSSLSFGIETEVSYGGEGLHFWLDPGIVPHGYAWLFPCGDKARVGVGSYRAEGRLRPRLEAFLERLGLPMGEIHGGYFPSRARPVTVGEVFLVGDAAGHCLPLTGEGIRPALFFARLCGFWVREAIRGKISPEEARQRYRESVRPFLPYHRLLRRFQDLITALSPRKLEILLTLLHPVSSPLLRLYLFPPRKANKFAEL